MTWYIKKDKTPGVITAKNHVQSSSHKNFEIKPLPQNAMIFCMGKWEEILKESFGAKVYLEKLKQFLGFTPVYKIPSNDDWCFVHGGPGAPVCADAVETLHALGVNNIVLVGMVGGFGINTEIGDVVIPGKILSREGTSLHYVGRKNWAKNIVDCGLCEYLDKAGFKVLTDPTVSTDAVYRQTFKKENCWRKKGCIGVDCEGSAFLNVAKFLNLQAQCVFVVSDKHPQNETVTKSWQWGIDYNGRKKFISKIVKYFISKKI